MIRQNAAEPAAPKPDPFTVTDVTPSTATEVVESPVTTGATASVDDKDDIAAMTAVNDMLPMYAVRRLDEKLPQLLPAAPRVAF